jgi:hypothetical protein
MINVLELCSHQDLCHDSLLRFISLVFIFSHSELLAGFVLLMLLVFRLVAIFVTFSYSDFFRKVWFGMVSFMSRH